MTAPQASSTPVKSLHQFKKPAQWLLAAFLAVLGYFAASNLGQKVQEQNNAIRVLEWTRTSIAVSRLAHELQKERGISRGFLASGGDNFSDALVQQHAFTNQALGELRAHLTELNGGQSPEATAIGQALPAPDELSALRNSIKRFTISTEGIFERYSHLVDQLFGQLLATMNAGNSGSIYRQQLSFIFFLQVKELAGQERSTVTSMLATRDFSLARIIGFHRLKAAEESGIKKFERLADAGLLPSYQELNAQPYNRHADEIRRLIVEIGAGDRKRAGRIPSPEQWFELASHKIDDMGRLEQVFSSHLMESATRLEKGARHDLMLNMLVVVMSFSLAGFLIVHIWHGGKAAEESLELAGAVFRSSADAILVTDTNLRILEVNDAFSKITQYWRGEVIGQTPALWKSGRQEPAYYAEIWRSVTETGSWKGEVWNRRKNGELYPALISITAVKDASGAVRHYIGMIVDLSKRKQTEALLERLRTFDPVTSLPNREAWLSAVGSAVAEAYRHSCSFAVLTLGLDRFKRINDSLGHALGDRVLIQAGRRIKESVGPHDLLARLDGDCFALLLPDAGDMKAATTMCESILEAFAAPLEIDHHQLDVTASIGIAFFPSDGEDTDALRRNSESAMHKAKEEGPGSYAFYSLEMNTRGAQLLLLERMLRRGLERQEFSLVFQPQLSAIDGRLVGVEALLRWFNQELGNVSPVQFIPIAEESGLILQIGEWVMREACREIQALRQSLGVELMVAVNLSARQFRSKDLMASVRLVLDETGLPTRLLELEITEGLLMTDPANTTLILDGLRQMGVHVALDDFGTGYSSLSYLKKFPIDRLKIDRAFVRDLPDNEQDRAIARTVLALGLNLGMEVLAEGVETEAQADFLRNEGCDLFQGYLYGKPMPAEQLAEHIRSGRYWV